MPRKRKDENDDANVEHVEKVVKEQLRGWKVARPQAAKPPTRRPEDCAKGPSVTDLREKFLGDAPAADTDLRTKYLGDDDEAATTDEQDDAASEPAADPDFAVVRVTPQGGGPEQIADVRKGKAKIVSG